MKAKLTLPLTLLVAGSGLGLAQERGRSDRSSARLPNIVRALDLNQDGELSPSEIESAPASLAKLDRDGDGEVNGAELGGQEAGRRGDRRRGTEQRRRGGGPRPDELGAMPGNLGDPGIAWYGRLDLALAEAQRTNRPILFMAAASQCGGVPGVF